MRKFGKVLLLSVACLTLSASLTACQSPQQRAETADQRFDELFSQKEYLKARVEIRNAIRERDGDVAYWIKLGRVELAMQNFFNAYSAYSRALELQKDNQEAMEAVANLALSGGALDEALKHADQVLKTHPLDPDMQFVKGSVAYKQGRLAEAQAIAQQMLRADPANDAGAILLARVHAAGGDFDGAIQLMEQALRRRLSVNPLLALLDFYRTTKNQPGIESTYARLFRLQPHNIELKLGYARELYLADNPAKALAIIDSLLKARPRDQALQGKIVQLWVSVGNDAIAVEQIRRFARQGNGQMKIALGRLALEEGHPEEAARLLSPFVDKGEIAPDNVQANVLYATALSAMGQTDEALVRATRVLDFDKTEPQALLLRIRISSKRGNLDQALNDAQVLGRENPDIPGARLALAEVYALRKERELADAAYRRATDDLSESTQIMGSYINYLVNTDRSARALAAAQEFTDRNPGSIEGWRIRGNLCITIGDDVCAQAALDALGKLSGGDRSQKQLALVLEQKKAGGAALPQDLSAITQQILSGKADLRIVARQLILDGRLGDVEKIGKAVLARQPRNSVAELVLAGIQRMRGDTVGGETAVRAILARYPDQPLAYVDLAMVRFAAGDRSEAFALLKRGLARLPNNPELLSSQAALQERSGDHASAIKSYRQLVRAQPSNLIAVNNLISLLTDYGTRPAGLDEAMAYAPRLLSIELPAFYDTRGWLLLKVGRPKDAVPLLEQAVAANGAPAVYEYHLAEALQAAGDKEGARTHAKKALDLARREEIWISRARQILSY